MANIKETAKRLASEGPVKIESTPRRLRGLFAGKYIFDTLEAKYVWENNYYPYFYIPRSALIHTNGVRLETTGDSGHSGFSLAELKVDWSPRTCDNIVVHTGPGTLHNLVKIDVSSLDAWFVEDEKLLGSHPKDPYKRVETIPSSREIRVEVDGVVVAQSTQNVFLFETMLRPRYYLSPATVRYDLLRESDTTTYCPYKGLAKYYDLSVNGKVIKDAVWYYEYPTPESALIAGRLCFYNEKMDVFVDGVKEVK